MINVKMLLREMLDQEASDIHLKVGSPTQILKLI